MNITARFENGVFKPLECVTIDEGTLVEVRVISHAEQSYANRLKPKSRSVGDFAFHGMWKDRADIADSVEYVNSLRRDFRG